MDLRSERLARRFDPWLLVAAVLVVAAIAIEQSSWDRRWPEVARVLDWVIWLAFLAEAVTMFVGRPEPPAVVS